MEGVKQPSVAEAPDTEPEGGEASHAIVTEKWHSGKSRASGPSRLASINEPPLSGGE
jgi:hypothetical protein